MQIYLAIKFYEDMSNRKLIEDISETLQGIASKIIFCTEPKDLVDEFKKL